MSRVKLLLDVISDLRSLADSVEAVANAMVDPDVPVTEPKKETAPKQKPKAETETVEFEKLFEVLKKLSEDGFRTEVKALLTKHGVPKLSELPKEQYAAVLAEAEEIRNGNLKTRCAFRFRIAQVAELHSVRKARTRI